MKTLPIRVRLTLWYSLILVLALAAFGAVANFVMTRSIRRSIDAGLRQRVEGIRGIIDRTAPEGLAELRDELNEYDEGQNGRGHLRVADAAGRIIYSSPGVETLSEEEQRAENGKPFTEHLGEARFRVLRQSVTAAGATYDVEVSVYTQDFDSAIEGFHRVLFSMAPLVLILASLGGYWMSRRALAPVDEIIRAARSIGVNSLSERLTVPRTGDELERLASTLNEMLGRLEASVQRIIRFTADASHELRTPVSVIRTNAEVTLRKSRSDAEYREALQQILQQSEEVSRLIEQMLDLARADSGAAALSMVRADLREPVERAARHARVLADAKQLKTSTQLPEAPLFVQGDPAALERLFLILLDNAVKFTPGGGTIEVELTTRDGMAVVEVRDTGIGVAQEELDHIFERFYQADRSRSRGNGGSGLGLAIGRWIAQSHGGSITAESEPGKGSAFRVSLPLAS
jgi:heavy metal sensor kinase